LEVNKKIYFVSDVHLGLPNHEISLEREKLFVKWLDEIQNDAQEIYLVGDIFDFWFEYKYVVPRGFTRLLGKIAEITDKGIPVHFFTGNHDIWVRDYLPKETGVIIHRKKLVIEFNHKWFMIAHGDGLGPADKGFKRLKKVFTNPISNWIFARIHPNFGVSFAHFWSHRNREVDGSDIYDFMGEDNEWLVLYAKRKLTEKHYDYFIFGHRHIPIDIIIGKNTHFINLGDWISNFTYAVFDGEKVELKKYVK
jgi:UDP-2,3-diacylglucosamine hydrolase